MGPPHVVDVDGEEAEDLGIRTAKHWVGLARCVRHLLVVKLLLLHKLSLLRLKLLDLTRGELVPFQTLPGANLLPHITQRFLIGVGMTGEDKTIKQLRARVAKCLLEFGIKRR